MRWRVVIDLGASTVMFAVAGAIVAGTALIGFASGVAPRMTYAPELQAARATQSQHCRPVAEFHEHHGRVPDGPTEDDRPPRSPRSRSHSRPRA
jgi:hypothetical protein